MKNLTSLFGLLLLTATSVLQQAQAYTAVSAINPEFGQAGVFAVGGQKPAQSFTTGDVDFNLESLTPQMSPFGEGSSGCTITIYSNGSNNLPDVLLWTLSGPANPISGGNGLLNTYVPATPIVLTARTTYWWSAAAAAGIYNFGFDAPPVTTNGFTAGFSTYLGNQETNPYRVNFVLTGTDAVPPPPPNTPGQLYLFSTVSPATAPGQALVTIRRTGTLGAVTVSYATADGTAIAGRDYTATSGTAAFAANQTDQTISVPLLAAAATGSTFTVQLSNATGGATIQAPGSLTVTISGVPPAPSPYIAAAANAYAQAATYFAAGDQANGYFCYAYYQYYLYLLDPANTGHLTSYYQNLANAYYLSYTAAGQPAAALAWYNYFVSFI